MGSTTRSALFFSVAAILFVSALGIGFYLFGSIADTLSTTFQATTRQDPNVYSTLRVTDSYTVYGEEVFQSIAHMQEVDYNIVVDGYTFTPSTDVHTMDVAAYVDVTAKYKPMYQRDASGKLIEVDYIQE